MINILIAILVSLSNIAATETEHRITCYDSGRLTADGTVIDWEAVDRGEQRIVAVSRQHRAMYPYGTIIFVEGHGFYTVRDTMSKWVSEKWREGTIDIAYRGKDFREWKRVWIIWRAR